MDIDDFIHQLEKMRGSGSKRVFLLDATNNVILDPIEISMDRQGDTIIQGD